MTCVIIAFLCGIGVGSIAGALGGFVIAVLLLIPPSSFEKPGSANGR